jgi:hypothetical protein
LEPQLDHEIQRVHEVTSKILVIRLDATTMANSTLFSSSIIEVQDVRWVKRMGSTNDYLYELIERLGECQRGKIKLYRKEDGSDGSDSDPEWKDVSAYTEIEGGYYLCSAGNCIPR